MVLHRRLDTSALIISEDGNARRYYDGNDWEHSENLTLMMKRYVVPDVRDYTDDAFVYIRQLLDHVIRLLVSSWPGHRARRRHVATIHLGQTEYEG